MLPRMFATGRFDQFFPQWALVTGLLYHLPAGKGGGDKVGHCWTQDAWMCPSKALGRDID